MEYVTAIIGGCMWSIPLAQYIISRETPMYN